jgi:tetratricopeptide (TPR) repeat protein
LALAERQDDPNLLSRVLAALTQTLGKEDDKAAYLPRAIDLAERAVDLQRGLGDQEGLLDAMLNAGVVWSAAGDAVRTREYDEAAVELARRLRDRVREAVGLMHLGAAHHQNGEPRRALRTYEKALETARRSNVKPLIALSSWRLANSVEQSGNRRAALKYYEQCLAALDPAEVRDPTPAQVQAKIAALRG